MDKLVNRKIPTQALRVVRFVDVAFHAFVVITCSFTIGITLFAVCGAF